MAGSIAGLELDFDESNVRLVSEFVNEMKKHRHDQTSRSTHNEKRVYPHHATPQNEHSSGKTSSSRNLLTQNAMKAAHKPSLLLAAFTFNVFSSESAS